MTKNELPRLMLAGPGGDCGKTFVAVGLAAAWRRRGVKIAPFKKGPDYIDAAWLSFASGVAARNLDTWMMNSSAVLDSFLRHAAPDGISLVEANRGFYDGENEAGNHSSAELSKLLQLPVVLIIPAVKVTRTAAAVALGLKLMDPQVQIAGVILNRVANARQETIIRAAIENDAGLPVLGVIPRVDGELFSSRHIGLVTPEENLQSSKSVDLAAQIIEKYTDLERMKAISESATPMDKKNVIPISVHPDACGLRIGFFKSPAFTFYYPENLEAIDRCGAAPIPIDPLKDPALPEIDGLYIGGGFPETHAALLSANAGFRSSVLQAANLGLPIWAECGGLIFLCRSVQWKGNCYPMAGVFPADVVMENRPVGHGYEEIEVTASNPFIGTGTVLRGHEFHYSRLEAIAPLKTAFKVTRGVGLGNGRDGLIFQRTLASYLHIHALGSPEWASGLLTAARFFKSG
jgi:cobyrinic acid a,c-diamide synthase